MKSKIVSMLGGIAALGVTLAAVPATADPGHGQSRNGEGQRGYYPGPGNSRIPYQTGYYMDDRRQRQSYTYPSDWRRYGRPQSWYQGHPSWHTFDHPDYYRRGGQH